jgi:hypothetical protein
MDFAAFFDWLRARGIPEAQLPTYERGARWILEQAAGARVLPKHVDAAIRAAEARRSSIQTLASLHRIGQALLEFDRLRPPDANAAMAEPAATSRPIRPLVDEAPAPSPVEPTPLAASATKRVIDDAEPLDAAQVANAARALTLLAFGWPLFLAFVAVRDESFELNLVHVMFPDHRYGWSAVLLRVSAQLGLWLFRLVGGFLAILGMLELRGSMSDRGGRVRSTVAVFAVGIATATDVFWAWWYAHERTTDAFWCLFFMLGAATVGSVAALLTVARYSARAGRSLPLWAVGLAIAACGLAGLLDMEQVAALLSRGSMPLFAMVYRYLLEWIALVMFAGLIALAADRVVIPSAREGAPAAGVLSLALAAWVAAWWFPAAGPLRPAIELVHVGVALAALLALDRFARACAVPMASRQARVAWSLIVTSIGFEGLGLQAMGSARGGDILRLGSLAYYMAGAAAVLATVVTLAALSAWARAAGHGRIRICAAAAIIASSGAFVMSAAYDQSMAGVVRIVLAVAGAVAAAIGGASALGEKTAPAARSVAA